MNDVNHEKLSKAFKRLDRNSVKYDTKRKRIYGSKWKYGIGVWGAIDALVNYANYYLVSGD